MENNNNKDFNDDKLYSTRAERNKSKNILSSDKSSIHKDDFLMKVLGNKKRNMVIFGVVFFVVILLVLLQGVFGNVLDSIKQHNIKSSINSFYTDKNREFLDLTKFNTSDLNKVDIKNKAIVNSSNRELNNLDIKQVKYTKQAMDDFNKLYESPIIQATDLNEVGLKEGVTEDSLNKITDLMNKTTIATGTQKLLEEGIKNAKKDISKSNEIVKKLDDAKDTGSIGKDDLSSIEEDVKNLHSTWLQNKLDSIEKDIDVSNESTYNNSSSNKEVKDLNEAKKLKEKIEKSTFKNAEDMETAVSKLYPYFSELGVSNWYTSDGKTITFH